MEYANQDVDKAAEYLMVCGVERKLLNGLPAIIILKWAEDVKNNGL